MTTPTLSSIPQGDPALLETELAQQLLASTNYARLAFVAPDGTPRVHPIWFHWTGAELVFGTTLNARKVAALRKNPAVAVTIDTQDPPNPPRILQLRGPAAISAHDDVFDEWYAAARRYLGAEAAEAWRAGYRGLPHRWARIALRPTWVGLLDFETRLPAAMAG
jgi:PPOX class probable F420-dependent enzyme